MPYRLARLRGDLFWLLLVIATAGCSVSDQAEVTEDQSPPTDSLAAALSFHASFDHGPNADFARGDAQIYTAPKYDQLDQASPGIDAPDVTIEDDAGRIGSALKFSRSYKRALFYRSEKNLAYSTRDWAGTISFWLNLDPDEDLEPGYCDPIQVTDTAYNDAALWVDFSKDPPREFRIGVFGDLEVWNPQKISPNDNPDFINRLVAVTNPPFQRGSWTHIVMTHTGLNSEAGGTARLYLDGDLQGAAEGIQEPFSWDLPSSTIRLGINYVGLFDELACFDRALSDEEVRTLHELEGGVGTLLRHGSGIGDREDEEGDRMSTLR